MLKNKFILFSLSFSIIVSSFANTEVNEYSDIETAQLVNYTLQQETNRNLLYQMQGSESTSLITPEISASQLVNQIDTDELYQKKQIKQFIDSVNLSGINSIDKANSLLLQATNLIKSNISVEELTSIINLCDSIIKYTSDQGFKTYNYDNVESFISQKNIVSFGGFTTDGKFISAGKVLSNGKFIFEADGFESLQKFLSSTQFVSFGGLKSDGKFESAGNIFKADQILLNVSKLWDNYNFSVDKLEKLIVLQDKIFDYLMKNNIAFSNDMQKIIAGKLVNIVQNVPQLLTVFDKQNQIIGWILQHLKDYYLSNSKEFKQLNVEKWNKWKKIIENPLPDVVKNKYKVPHGRFMFEVWTPQNINQRNNLQKQLDFIKKNGYIGVVVVWDGYSDYNKLVQIQDMILKKGFKIWLAFSTMKQDSLEKTTFVQPQYYYKGLKELSKKSQAFLMGWRRTSVHLNQQVKGWQNYTMNALRQGNPNIGFIGQAYFGYNGTHSASEYHLYYNYRDNYNAILAINFGFVSVNPKWALNKLKSSLNAPNMQYVCLIQGVTARYLLDHPGKRKRTRAQYRRINQLLEKRFLNAGFDAVAGLSGDGVNRNGAQDDMCLSKNHVPSSQKF